MGWWESFVVTATLLTVFALLRSKPSAHDEPNSQRYSRFSRRTEARPTLLEPDQTDTRRTYHVSYCHHCRSRDAVPLAETALERRPWRITWTCGVCRNLAEARVPPGFIEELRSLDRAGGTRISLREYRDFTLELNGLDEAVRDELLT